MKLGISYNLFDGEELLEKSINQIRNLVDYISVVYQITSNYGNPCDSELVPLLQKLQSQGLIDELVEYTPDLNQGPHFNEVEKRNLGLMLSKNFGCTHHMSMDSDEIYLESEFLNIKDIIERGGYDSSYCQMLTYYKSWEFILDPPEDYYVALIYKIKENSKYVFGANTPVLVDPTRRMSHIAKPLVLNRDTIQMHHGSYIRNDMRKKLTNSSALVNFKNDVERLVNHYDNWVYPNEVLLAGLPSKLHKVKNTNNLLK
jgi:hypothetical protein